MWLLNQPDGSEERVGGEIFRCNSQRDFDEDRNSTFLDNSMHCGVKLACSCALNNLRQFPPMLQVATLDVEYDNGAAEILALFVDYPLKKAILLRPATTVDS